MNRALLLAPSALLLGLTVTGCPTKQEIKPDPVVIKPLPPKPPPEPSAEERYNNGVKAIAAKDYEAAKTELTKSIDKKADFAPAQYNLGFVLSQLGDLAGAVAAYEKVKGALAA